MHYGGYAAQLKKAVDRLLPVISPFFRKAGDMTHHAKPNTVTPEARSRGEVPACLVRLTGPCRFRLP